MENARCFPKSSESGMLSIPVKGKPKAARSGIGFGFKDESVSGSFVSPVLCARAEMAKVLCTPQASSMLVYHFLYLLAYLIQFFAGHVLNF